MLTDLRSLASETRAAGAAGAAGAGGAPLAARAPRPATTRAPSAEKNRWWPRPVFAFILAPRTRPQRLGPSFSTASAPAHPHLVRDQRLGPRWHVQLERERLCVPGLGAMAGTQHLVPRADRLQHLHVRRR